MQWIQQFSNSHIPFYIYRLNKGDCITYTIELLNHRSIIILYGIIYLLKIFTNRETITIAILKKGDIIKEQHNLKYANYVLVAGTKSFVMSFSWEDFIKHKYKKSIFFKKITECYKETLYKYETMHYILSHKSTKKRIIQLILFLCKDFAFIQNNEIIIPFYISQITISLIVGSNKTTVNKILNELCMIKAIYYSSNKYICLKDPFILSYCYNKLYTP